MNADRQKLNLSHFSACNAVSLETKGEKTKKFSLSWHFDEVILEKCYIVMIVMK